jgi:two-component system, chemotaxis family, protein-glutamate methylesterase/glutaminase
MSLNIEGETGSLVRVLVVDDSAFMRTALSRMIATAGGLEVVGTARDGTDALAKIVALDPDVVTLDIEMPGMDGVETLRRIMQRFPRPVIIVSAFTEREAHATLSALAAGAFDCIAKHLSSASLDILHLREDLIIKIRAAAGSRKKLSHEGKKKPSRPCCSPDLHKFSVAPAIVALGASTGGPRALEEILPLFPRDLAAPMLIVQHMPVGFTAPFAERLNSMCAVEVREAVHDETIQPGVVYIAPSGKHMTVQRSSNLQASIVLDESPANHIHRPSVDIMMKSVARDYGELSVGVILTGMGADGAEGMGAIRRAGGLTIGQDEASCTVYGMPRVCAEAGSLARVLPLSEIPSAIVSATGFRKRA